MLGLMPGTAAADPAAVSTPEQVAQQVAAASHELEVVSEQVNDARVELDQHQADVDTAKQALAEAQAQLDALDSQIRQLARSAFTGSGLTQLDVLLTSDSAEDFVSQLGTLDAIAGHTNEVLGRVAAASDDAKDAEARAEAAAQQARAILDEITTKQRELEQKVADYRQQYAALTAPQRQQADEAHGGRTLAAPPSGVVASSAAAQKAVDTALAQVGDPYSWGAGGPDAFDCSGLTQYAYAAAGVSLPHSSRMQSQMGTPVSVSQLQPGDLLFYYSPVSHVAMYIGNGQMVHASTYGKPVQVVAFDSMSGFNSARRIAG